MIWARTRWLARVDSVEIVIPAKAGIQAVVEHRPNVPEQHWIPASAGMTTDEDPFEVTLSAF